MAKYVLDVRKKNGFWAFDDDDKQLKDEGLVAGIDSMLNMTCRGSNNVKLTVSDDKQQVIDPIILEFQGDGTNHGEEWYCYWSPLLRVNGWLCPNFKLYFDEPPDKMYISVVPQ